MNLAQQRVRSTQFLLGVMLAAKALAWGVGVVAFVLAIIALIDLLLHLPLEVRAAGRNIALLAAVLAVSVVFWKARHIASRERVALWIEEQVPWLRYALVTALDPRHSAAAISLESAVGEAQWGGGLAVTALRALARPLVLLVAAGALLLFLPPGAGSRVLSPRSGDSRANERALTRERGSALERLSVNVSPPPYSGRPMETLDDPSGISALVGSAITIRGRGDGVTALAGDDSLGVRAEAERWSISLMMPSRAQVVRLRESARERLLVLEPQPDDAPDVLLFTPRRDTVFRRPSGRLALLAEAADDIGLAAASFEYIISSGEGESFTFRSGTIGAVAPRNAQRVRLAAAIQLDTLRLASGDVLHLRAIARDGNIIGGPSTGASETRTIRIARAGEYDSIAVEGAPPLEADASALSQRMLILLAERLEVRRRRLSREVVIAESRRIAVDQHSLRRRVAEVIFTRLGEDNAGEHAHGPGEHEHEARVDSLTPEALLAAAEAATGHSMGDAIDFAQGESPVVAINRPLLQAYNFMWEAARELELGEPGAALPSMRSALEALQRAREAERYFLRGRAPVVVVDIGRVRMQGKETGVPAPSPARRNADESGARAVRFASAVGALGEDSAAAVDSLILLRVEALADAPALATALGEAITALRFGRDATGPLQRARRLIVGEPVARDSLSKWSRGW